MSTNKNKKEHFKSNTSKKQSKVSQYELAKRRARARKNNNKYR